MYKKAFAGGTARLLATMMVAASLVLACAPAAHAIPWVEENSEGVSLAPQWTDLAYYWKIDSYNEQLSQSVSRVHTRMMAKNIGRSVQSGAIRVQSFLRATVSQGGGQVTTIAGPAVTNPGVNPMNEWVTSQFSEIYYPAAEVYCLGNAILRKPDLTNVTLNTGLYHAASVAFPIMSNDGEVALNAIAESDIELRADGRTYGSPYEGPDGEAIMPDMLRVVATNGQIGYVSMAEMDEGIMLGASTPEEETEAYVLIEDLKAQALKNAFAEYYGVDALSTEEALACATELAFENGERDSRLAATASSQVELASAIESGLISAEKASDLLGASAASANLRSGTSATSPAASGAEIVMPSSISIDEEAYGEILDRVRAETAIHLPVYAEDGFTIVGELVVHRF